MQSALQQPDLGGADPWKVAIVRIVTYELANGELHEYLYLLDNPATNRTGVSEIAALSNRTFIVDERDSTCPPGAHKKLWRIDLTGATDVGPGSEVRGASYDRVRGGLLVGGRTLEALVANQDTNAATATLQSHGIMPVSKELGLDLGALLDRLDAKGRVYPHDKVEGLYVDPSGTRIILSNDDDFGIGGVASPTPPFQLTEKVNPATGRQDGGEFLIIDTTRLPALPQSDTVPPAATSTKPTP
jgi:hypothetical protein